MSATETGPSPFDFYLVDELLTDDERGIRETLRAFCDAEVLPIINDYWERAEFPFVLLPKIAELGLAGGTIQGYGCPGMTAVAAGLVSMEWARADGSMARSSACTRTSRCRRSTCSAPRSSRSAGCRRWPTWRRSARSR